MILAWNGHLMEDKEAVVSVYDHGFLYGMGLFETFRTYDGEAFLLEEHLMRLSSSCRELGILYLPLAHNVQELIRGLLRANGLTDAYFRLSVSAGVEPLGLPAGDYGHPNEILYIKPLPPRDERLYQEGKALQLLKQPRNTPEGIFGRTKSFHYMNVILGKREMSQYPWAAGAEGLFLDQEGHVAEGLVSNVFAVYNGKLVTPPLSTGILGGIIRRWVLHCGSRVSVPVEEALLTWDELIRSEEIFLTNSVQEIVPVTRLYDGAGKGYGVGSGMPGPVTAWFMERYAREAWRCRDDKDNDNDL